MNRPDSGRRSRLHQTRAAGRRHDRDIARLALPALGTLVAEPLYVLTDTAIVGHLGTNQLAGLALASTVLLTGYAIFVFLAYGTTAAVARLVGAGRAADAAHNAIQSIWLAALLALLVSALGAVTGERLLEVLGGSGVVLEQAWVYLRISLLGVPALLISLAGTGYLRGLQNMRTPLVVTIAGAVINLVIEVVLIHGFGFGIGASALGSVVAQWAVAVTYLFLIAGDVRRLGVPLGPHLASIASLMRVGSDLFIRTVALRATLVVTTAVAASMGALSLAAHQIVFEVWNFLAMALDALAIAAQAMVGRALGADNPQAARAVARRMLTWGIRFGVAALIGVLILRGVLVHLFTPDPRVVALGTTLLAIAALWQPINSIAFTLDGILIGAGDTRFLAWSMALAAGVYIPLAWWVGRTGWGIDALWVALGVLMIIRAATLGLRFMGGAWTESR